MYTRAEHLFCVKLCVYAMEKYIFPYYIEVKICIQTNSFYNHHSRPLSWGKVLSVLELFIRMIHLGTCTSKGLLMLEFSSLKILINNEMTHFSKFITRYVTYSWNRHACLDYKQGHLPKKYGHFSTAITIQPGLYLSSVYQNNTSNLNII